VNEIASTNEKNKEIVKSLSIYNSLSEDKLIIPEMKNISQRIRAARSLKENLSDKYKINLTSIDFTRIKNISQRLRVNKIEIYSNNIEMEVEAVTDEIVMSFCSSILEEAPGYITIKSIDLNKVKDISSEDISAIKDANTELPALVKAKIIFHWRTLDNKEVTSK
jgi:hypothetical protein